MIYYMCIDWLLIDCSLRVLIIVFLANADTTRVFLILMNGCLRLWENIMRMADTNARELGMRWSLLGNMLLYWHPNVKRNLEIINRSNIGAKTCENCCIVSSWYHCIDIQTWKRDL